MASRPLVLLTPDVEVRQGRRGPSRLYTTTSDYARAVLGAGGIPLIAPYSDDEAVLDELVARADALVLTGGDFDIDPALFGEAPHEKLGTLKPDRTSFERGLHERARACGLPVLGVCGGMQLMNALLGGDLWQDIDSQNPGALQHQQPNTKAEPGHVVDVKAGTRLATIVGAGELGVNSTHHQAVRSLAPSLVVAATSPDGIVEAFEAPGEPFYVGVQWHPEAMPHEKQQAIYRALVDAAG